MAIEFNCPQCGNRLRMPEETAGQQARCPQCSTVQVVPSASSEPDAVSSAEEVNPYASPAASSYDLPPAPLPQTIDPRRMVSAPALALMVLGGIRMALLLMLGAFMAIGVTMNTFQPNGRAAAQPFGNSVGGVAIAVVFLGLAALSGFQVYGGYRMRRLQNRTVAMLAAVATLLPVATCFNFCCLFIDLPLGLAFGIWSIVVLSNSQVAAAFQR